MDFKPYPSYKNSGVEWLGVIPEHWQQKPIWSLFSRVKRVNHPNEPLLSVYRDYGVIPKASRDDNHNRASEDLTPYQLVRPNDLVINKMKAWQGSIAMSEHQGIVSPAYYVYEPKQPYCSKYIHFLIRSTYFIQSYKNFSKGIRVNQWDLEHDAFTHIDLLLPPLSEQNKIVSFLDTETSRIDHLIAKQEKLIELLEEHRKTVIFHAVTKGLDSNVPMKDSGVEWLGEVTQDSTLIKLKFLTEIKGRIGFRGYTTNDIVSEGEGAITLSPSNLNYKNLDLTKKTFLSWEKFHESPEIQVKSNDVIIVKTGSSLGKIGWVNNINQSLTINPQLAIIRCKKYLKINPKYLFYVMLSEYFKASVISSNTGGTMPTVTQESIGKIIIPHYSIDVQNQIVEILDSKLKKIDTLIAKQKGLIEKLKEYRTSIISHAITGKIDVRDLVA